MLKVGQGVPGQTVLSQNDDGFKISEYDLKRRGPGELFGLKQSGITNFKIANLIEDYAILKEASKDAQFIVLNEQKYKKYLEYIKEKMKDSTLVMMN